MRHRRHLRATVFLQHDIAFARQLAQHFTQRRTRDAIGLGQFHLIEINARLQRLGQDAPAQIVNALDFLTTLIGFHRCSPA